MRDRRAVGLVLFGGVMALVILLCACAAMFAFFSTRSIELEPKLLVPADSVNDLANRGKIRSFDYNPQKDQLIYLVHGEDAEANSTGAQIYMYDEDAPNSRRLVADRVGTRYGYYVGFGSGTDAKEHIFYFDSNIPGLVELKDGRRSIYTKTSCTPSFLAETGESVGMVVNIAENYKLTSYHERYLISGNEMVIASDCTDSATIKLYLSHISEVNPSVQYHTGTEKIMSIKKADFYFSHKRGVLGATNSTNCASVHDRIDWGRYYYEVSACEGNIRFAESGHIFNKTGLIFLDDDGIYVVKRP